MGESSIPRDPRTVRAAGVFVARRFIGWDDLQITVPGSSAKGVSRDAAVLNDVVSITMGGSEVVEAGGVVAIGDYIVSDASGRAVKASNLAVATGATAVTSSAANGAILAGSVPPEKINGIAMEAAAASGDFIEVWLTK